MKITQITPPTVEPVTLAEARLHLKLDTDGSPATHPDDDLVENLIAAARQWSENYTRRVFCQSTWDLYLDKFPAKDFIEIPRPPLISITSLNYTDWEGTESALTEGTEFVVDTVSHYGRVVLEYSETWPTDTLHPNNPIKIRFVAGYASTSSPADYRENVPQAVKQAILLTVGHLYANRENTMVGANIMSIPFGAESLLNPYRAILI